MLSCGADPAVQNANGHNAVDLATSDIIRRIYIEELLRATAASECVSCLYLLVTERNQERNKTYIGKELMINLYYIDILM